MLYRSLVLLAGFARDYGRQRGAPQCGRQRKTAAEEILGGGSETNYRKRGTRFYEARILDEGSGSPYCAKLRESGSATHLR
jgi:hypothetical protein